MAASMVIGNEHGIVAQSYCGSACSLFIVLIAIGAFIGNLERNQPPPTEMKI